MSAPSARTVLFLNDTGNRAGGAERSLLWTVSALDRSQFSPCIVLGEDGELAGQLRQTDAAVFIVPMRPISRTYRPWSILRSAVEVERVARRIARLSRPNRPALVIANKNTMALYAARVARLLRSSAVWHVRNYARRFGWVARRIVSRFDALLFVSDAVRQPFDAAFPRLRSRFHTLHESIPPERIHRPERSLRNDVRRVLGVPYASPLVGTLGRITQWKGQHVFVAAAPKILARLLDAHFVIAGDCIGSPAELDADREYLARLHRTCTELGIADRVHFTGYWKNVPALLSAFDVFVLPSLAEPYGLVLLEAMANGLPIVATQAGGVPEILTHGQHALLVPQDNPNSLADAVVALLINPEYARTLAESAQQHLLKDFAYEQYMAQFQAVTETCDRRIVKPLRILTVASWAWPDAEGGAFRIATEVALRLAQRGHRVYLLTARSDPSLPGYESFNGLHIHRYPILPRRSLSLYLSFRRSLREAARHLLATERFDVAHLHHLFSAHAALHALRDTPILYTCHMPYFLEHPR